MAEQRILLHLANRVRRAVDVGEVYYLEAKGDETLVRLRSKRRLRDVRSLGEVLAAAGPQAFLRIEDSYAVNPHRIRELRPRKSGRDWELRLEPPVNVVLPIGRASKKRVMGWFGE